MDPIDIASRIEHTDLRPEAREREVRQLCDEARFFHFAAVCVNPYRVSLATSELSGTSVHVCSVVGFPLGASTTEVKVAEADRAIRDGAVELDMVINIGALLDGDPRTVAADIASVRQCAANSVLKVIIESSLLESTELISEASLIAVSAGADFVKTSTGLHRSGGAKLDHVRLIRRVIGSNVRIKAAGGIRSLSDAISMLSAGADRLGTSASVPIMNEAVTAFQKSAVGR